MMRALGFGRTASEKWCCWSTFFWSPPVCVGIPAALIAITPAAAAPGARLPYFTLIAIIGAIAASATAWIYVATGMRARRRAGCDPYRVKPAFFERFYMQMKRPEIWAPAILSLAAALALVWWATAGEDFASPARGRWPTCGRCAGGRGDQDRGRAEAVFGVAPAAITDSWPRFRGGVSMPLKKAMFRLPGRCRRAGRRCCGRWRWARASPGRRSSADACIFWTTTAKRRRTWCGVCPWRMGAISGGMRIR